MFHSFSMSKALDLLVEDRLLGETIFVGD